MTCTFCDITTPVSIPLDYVPGSTWKWRGTFAQVSACFDTFEFGCTPGVHPQFGFTFYKSGVAVSTAQGPAQSTCSPFYWQVVGLFFPDCDPGCSGCTLVVTR